MATPDDLKVIFEKFAAGTATDEDLNILLQVYKGSERISLQFGKTVVNIGQGQGIQIGDRTYIELNREALKTLIEALRENQRDDTRDNYFGWKETCSDRQSLDKYFEVILQRLRQKGSLEICQNVVHKGRRFNHVVRIEDFELSFGLFSMRGEAFFIFSEFASMNMNTLQQFSTQCMQLAKEQVNPSTVGQAVFNFRVPTHICFAIAIVDKMDEKTKTEVQITNPFDRKVDLLWYEVPVIYELSTKMLYYYDKPSNFFENFKGEVVWQKLRTHIQEILMPFSEESVAGKMIRVVCPVI